MPQLSILFHDEFLVAVNKPYSWLTHKSPIARDAKLIVLQQLRDQLNSYVYPIHRLDRKTSGVLLFGLQPKTHKEMSKLFMNGEIQKTYFAIVRGFTKNQDIIDYELKNEAGKSQKAITAYTTIQQTEIPLANGKFQTARYSLIKLNPQTGRMHQIRRHMSHIFHPIIGDRPHGCNKQNRLMKEHFGFTEMLLHASKLEFEHPVTNQKVEINAPFFDEFLRMKSVLGFNPKI
jgi:tRNA pseudouridine65 synthase